MKRLILLLSLLSSSVALAIDAKPIGNPQSGGTTSFFSNIGGTITGVGGISNSGAFTLGPASGLTATHLIQNANTAAGVLTVKGTGTSTATGLWIKQGLTAGSGTSAQTPLLVSNTDATADYFKVRGDGSATFYNNNNVATLDVASSGIITTPVARSGTLTGSVTGSSYVDFPGLLSNGAQFSMFCTATTSGSTPGGALAYFWSTPGDGYTNVSAVFGKDGFTLGLNGYSVRLSNSGATKDYVCNYTYTHKP